MRTTVTLDADTEALVRRRMADRRVSFKQALNDAIRDGLTRRGARERFVTATRSMGTPAVNLDRALQLAGQLEDEALTARMLAGS